MANGTKPRSQQRVRARLAKGFALLGGAIVVAITVVTTGSILGRWLFNSPLLGDTEIVECGMAVVVACFLPLCQWRSENIIVDFFTLRASVGTRARLDRIGYLAVGVMLALIGWRTLLGAIDQEAYGTTTMLLQWPEWLAYALMSIPLIATAAIALYMAATGRGAVSATLPTRNPLPQGPGEGG